MFIRMFSVFITFSLMFSYSALASGTDSMEPFDIGGDPHDNPEGRAELERVIAGQIREHGAREHGAADDTFAARSAIATAFAAAGGNYGVLVSLGYSSYAIAAHRREVERINAEILNAEAAERARARRGRCPGGCD